MTTAEDVVSRRPYFAGLSRNVILLGLVSFFADVSSEMVYPLIPIFLTATLGAPVAALGLIEGLAEGTASVLKGLFGVASDRAGRRKPFVFAGYLLSAAGKPMLALAGVWPVVLAARFVDRIGKGARTAPRDALIAGSSEAGSRGRAFGFHRSADTLGAVVGPAIGLGLVALLKDDLRAVFTIALVPGLAGAALVLLVHETGASAAKRMDKPKLAKLPPRFWAFLGGWALFSLGNSSDTFLILRASQVGLPVSLVIAAYIVYNAVYALGSFPAGIWSDRVGRRRVLVVGLVVFAFVYLGFATLPDPLFVWPLFAVYGLYIAFTDGVGKAQIADLVPESALGSAIGVFTAATGLAAVVASVLAGVVWDAFGPAVPFWIGSASALSASVLLFAVLPRGAKSTGGH